MVAIRDGIRTWWASPAARATVFALLGGLVFHGLLLFGQLNSRDDAFVEHDFRLWAATAALSSVLWIAALGRGVRTVRALPASWRRGRSWWTASISAYAVLVLTAGMMLDRIAQGTSFQVPIRHFPAVVNVFIVSGAVAAAPWVLSIWLAQEKTGRAARETLPDGTADPSAVAGAVSGVLTVWRVIERSALALSLTVSTSVLTTGALRLALIGSGAVEPDGFPPYFVLGYGALIAALLVAVLLPLVLAWRAWAVSLVERTLPPPDSGLLDEELIASRARMEEQLHIDARFVRNPIALLSVLSPFATAVITTLIPSGG
ncbi:hypothetical protein [Streptomyces sp. NPDC056987]|uniref:hypothetical protein n=1 Tax=Streptomyces sp. NPDC056987 TaxID=3345988 RepID=UPI003639D3D8